MTKTHTYRGVVWLDLESPTDDEIGGVIKRYGLHPLVGEELKRASTVAKIDFYKDYILVVLTLPVRTRVGTTYSIVDREIDFVIGRNFLITARTETIEQLEYFGKIFEANAILNKEEKIDHAGYLFYYIVKRIYAGMVEDLENIRDALAEAETRIFGGDERDMVEALSGLSRELIDIKQIARMHHDVWEDMVNRNDHEFMGGEFAAYVRDIRDQFNVIHEIIVNARELLADLRETNDSLLTTKQNEVMKVLTLVAFIFYPLMFIAAIFTIPAGGIPLIGRPYGWTAIMIGMAVIVAFMWWFFKKRRWI
ncbi:MAG: magnesium transporter CorA family protein [Patescibacteria group bacterium]|nr:magnesium transporter CorA family protein [Patescibacteria group bacterium]MDE2172578.1 magnesium transporter CorA family protein [Patescibacteria group bacterium]